MSLIRKHVAVLQAWACLALVFNAFQMVNYNFSAGQNKSLYGAL